MVKAPFKVSYDGPRKFRIWGFGLGQWPMILSFGYNIQGSASTLPFGVVWTTTRKGVPVLDKVI